MADGIGTISNLHDTDTVPTNCFVCYSGETRWNGDVTSRSEYRGRLIMVCKYCREIFDEAIAQASTFGHRFRFIRKDEIPSISIYDRMSSPLFRHRTFRQIYKILLLLKERQEIRQKEVNWMIDELTKKVIKLPDKLAAIVGKTYAVCGDDFKLADDEALTMIRDLLEDLDPGIIKRNKDKRLTRS